MLLSGLERKKKQHKARGHQVKRTNKLVPFLRVGVLSLLLLRLGDYELARTLVLLQYLFFSIPMGTIGRKKMLGD